jgi:hypothetical protein
VPWHFLLLLLLLLLCEQMDILLQVNDYFGTEYEIDTPWTDLFAEPEEQQEVLRLQRLRSLESPRAAAAGPGAALAAALAAHERRGATGAAAAAAAGGGLTWLDAELPSEDEDDGSYSEPGELRSHTCFGCVDSLLLLLLRGGVHAMLVVSCATRARLAAFVRGTFPCKQSMVRHDCRGCTAAVAAYLHWPSFVAHCMIAL